MQVNNLFVPTIHEAIIISGKIAFLLYLTTRKKLQINQIIKVSFMAINKNLKKNFNFILAILTSASKAGKQILDSKMKFN